LTTYNIEKRHQLQQEYDSLRPVDYEELTEAADLLEHFRTYWDACADVPDPREARKQLVSKVIERVLVYEEEIVAIVLHGSFAVVLGENGTAPAMLADAVSAVLKNEGITTSLDSSKCGGDGVRSLAGFLIIAAFGDTLQNRIVGIISQHVSQ
jgi:hypothetical protein